MDGYPACSVRAADGQSPCTIPLVTASGHVDFRRNNHLFATESDRLYPEGDDLTVASGISNIGKVIAQTPNWNGALRPCDLVAPMHRARVVPPARRTELVHCELDARASS